MPPACRLHSQSWYNPQLTASQAERFYEGVEAEGRRRELAGEPNRLEKHPTGRCWRGWLPARDNWQSNPCS